MTLTLCREDGRLLTIAARGQFRKADLEQAQAALEAAIARHGKVRALFIAEDFQGWERGQDWGDIGFMVEHDDDIERIAVVGEARWREEILMFLGAGIRSAPVRFFEPGAAELARRWLAEGGPAIGAEPKPS
jgi:hypothetical protein